MSVFPCTVTKSKSSHRSEALTAFTVLFYLNIRTVYGCLATNLTVLVASDEHSISSITKQRCGYKSTILTISNLYFIRHYSSDRLCIYFTATVYLLLCCLRFYIVHCTFTYID